jgi:hypothetical protein
VRTTQARLGRGRGRVGRGVTLSAACLVIPATAHVLAGGGFPAAGPFLFGAGLLSVACVALADRRLSVGAIAALIFVSQPVFHVLLHLSAHGHGDGTSASAVGMVIGHALAAGALTVLLGTGEAVLWSMAALSAVLPLRRVRTPLRPTTAPQPVPQTAHPDDDNRNRYVLSIARTAPRRGPPLLSSI